MVRIRHRAEYFVVELPCAICHAALKIDTAWLVFPAERGPTVDALFCHRGCLDSHVTEVFGTPHVTLLRGHVALTRLSQSLGGPVAIDW